MSTCDPPCAGESPLCEGTICVACSVGSRDCDGQTPRSCEGGAWMAATSCGGATICSNGVCATARVTGSIAVGGPLQNATHRLWDADVSEAPRSCGGAHCITGGLRR